MLRAILLVVGAILPIVNPVGSAPMFLAMTHGADSATRRMLAGLVAHQFVRAAAGIADLRQLRAAALRTVGAGRAACRRAGAVRAGLADPDRGARRRRSAERRCRSRSIAISRAFYPLTLPLTVDPGAISVAVTIGANHSSSITEGTDRHRRRDHRRRDHRGQRLADLPLRRARRDLARPHATDGRAAPVGVHRAVHRRADRVERRQGAARGAAVRAAEWSRVGGSPNQRRAGQRAGTGHPP